MELGIVVKLERGFIHDRLWTMDLHGGEVPSQISRCEKTHVPKKTGEDWGLYGPGRLRKTKEDHGRLRKTRKNLRIPGRLRKAGKTGQYQER